MKRLLLLVLAVGLCIIVNAQVSSPVFTGNATGQKELSDRNYSFNIGSPIPYWYNGGSSVKLQVGFPYNALYLDRTFPGDLSVSKGYYADYVKLKWEIVNNADKIDHFEVYRKKLGEEDSVWVDNLTAEARKWEDYDCDANEIYQYTLNAVGIPGERVEGYSYVSGVGFRMPLATVTGRITYDDGTGAGGVTVTASTDDEIPASSIYLSDGGYIAVPQYEEMDIARAFTLQAFVKFDGTEDMGIFEKAENYALTYESGKFRFYVGNEYVEHEYETTGDVFLQINCVFDGNNAYIHIPDTYTDDDGYDQDTVYTATSEISTAISNNDTAIFLGRTDSLSFTGNIDEIRMWGTALSSDEILENYNCYIPGDEDGLLAYWRMNEGFGDHVYDISESGSDFNENHGEFTDETVSWSGDYPTTEQLGYKSLSDLEGNYIIAGIPFATGGSSYKFTPMMSPHYFEPEYKILFFNENANVVNNVDFTDLASVTVNLSVVYNTGTEFPVSDVYVKLDGSYLSDSNSEPVQTDENGTAEFSVPIGNHYLLFEKDGHVFESSYFPELDTAGNITTYLFDQNIPLLTITDTTRVKLAGRITGGAVEVEKTLGSKTNPSKNNIGVVDVELTTQKGFRIDTTTGKTISFKSDSETGEYEVWLLPEKYKASSIKVVSDKSNCTFNSDEDLELIDLTGQFTTSYETDSVFVKNNLDEMEFDHLDTTASYNLRKDWTYRSEPLVAITNKSGGKIISETEYVYSDDSGTDTIPLATEDEDGNVTYTFGYPIFNFSETYYTEITAYEKYINYDSGDEVVDKVPVTDGTIIVSNDIALEDKDFEFDLDESGEASYSFVADFPNIADPYTKNLNVTLKTESSNVEIETITAYILGGRPTGNNFVTTGPNDIDFILRDPPGSESYSFLEEGFTTTTSSTSSVSNGEEGSETLHTQLGATVSTTAGTPFFSVVTEIKATEDMDVAVEHSYSETEEYETSTEVTFSQAYSTSDDADFVGANGDVFIGHSTNIVYGISKMMEIMPKSEVPAKSDTISKYDNYAISIENGLRVNPEFNTMFVYSQEIIEEEIIPNLEYLRNNVIEGSNYVKVFTDASDEKYASNNDDEDVWGSEASEDKYDGPSYTYTAPDTDEDSVVVDSVRFYNQQIAQWEEALAMNEQQKLEAEPDENEENISFGAGSTYESSLGTESSKSYTSSYEWTITPSVAQSIGFEVNDCGATVSYEQKYSHSESGSSSSGSTTSQTVGFSLSDGDEENYISVDVKKCISGNGPVFVTRGGQTSCPYEGEEVTEYYEPGSHTLSYATMQIDGPQLSCDDPISPEVPETSPAYFTMNLANVSEAEKDNWYIIGVDVASNPYGAKVMMDGSAITDGIAVSVPYGETVVKTLEVYKGKDAVNDYEGLVIYLRSQCDEDIVETVSINAYFAPACSEVEFTAPSDGWVINADDEDIMTVGIGGYNLQHEGFSDIYFQYKPTNNSDWTTEHIFTNDTATANNKENATYIDNKSSITYQWDMSSMMDREYDIRLKTACSDGSTNYSESLSGTLDGQRPQVFGTPQPADGILDVDDDISIKFNEEIEDGLLTGGNFELTGTINNGEFLHEAYVRFNGTSDYAAIPEGISFNDKSFAIEFWMQTDQYSDMVLFSQGNDTDNNIEMGLTADKKVYFKVGTAESFTASLEFTTTVPESSWQHLGFVYDYENGDVFIYQNDAIILEQRSTSTEVSTSGKIYIARSAVGSGYFKGTMHELRIWSKVLDQADFYSEQYNEQTGNEPGLYGYWEMNEAFGDLSTDKASNRHMEVNADWEVDPGGWSWDFEEGGQIDFETSYFAITPDMNYTLEFWFKSSQPSDTVCFFSNQKGDGNEGESLSEKALSICGLPSGEIIVLSKGNVFVAAENNYFDDSWHHFALVVRRNGNVASLVDGEVQNEDDNSTVGGIAGANMVLGMQVWDNYGGTGSAYPYSGKIDEFRLWELARSTTQIGLDMNSKLSGDETALDVYFPFEGYFTSGANITELEETKINYANTEKQFVSESDDGFTKEAPNVKDVRSTEELSVSYVASSDEIIISTSENTLTQLEKNTVEITVQYVEDLFGNSMASPETWTAYVHRNQVRWEDESRSFTKELYAEMEFTSSIKNTGGQQIGYSITNLPAWLTASPSSGTINPESTLDITFTINSALNIGTYNQDISLETDNGYEEKLPITVKVYKTPPDWEVDASDYEYTMNIVGKVKIEGVLSTDIFDMVAAFVNDTIRGVSNVRYVEDFDSYYVFLNVYGNTEGEKLEFRVWDASAGQILDEVSPYDLTFVPNGVEGTTLDPVIFEAIDMYRQYIPLADGWNWVSFNKLSSKQDNLNSFFASLEPQQNDQVKTHGGGFSTYDLTTGWFGSIDSIDNRRMYQIKIGDQDTVIYSGQEIDPEQTPISLVEGWNHVGYLPDLSMSVDDAMRMYTADTSEVVKSQYAFAMYDSRTGWIGTLDLMQAGCGYMVYCKKASTLTYPSSTVYKNACVASSSTPPSGWDNDLSSYDGNLSIVATVNTDAFPDIVESGEMYLGAFIDDECHGYTSLAENAGFDYSPFFLTVNNSNNGDIMNFKLKDKLTGIVYSVVETRPFAKNAVLGTTQSPLKLTLGSIVTESGDYGLGNNYFRCYPNPFKKEVVIEFTGNGSNVSIDIINSVGAVVRNIFDGYAENGNNTLTWDGQNGAGVEVASGMYYVRYVSGNSVVTEKITKKGTR